MRLLTHHHPPRGPLRGIRISLRYIVVCCLFLVGCGATHEHTIQLSPAISGPTWTEDGTYGIQRAVPDYRDGKRRGIRILAITPGSLAEHLQLQQNDVLIELVGEPCTTVAECRLGTRRLHVAVQLRRPFSLVIARGEVTHEFRYVYPEVESLEL